MRSGQAQIAQLAEAIRRIEGGGSAPHMGEAECSAPAAVHGSAAPHQPYLWPPPAALRRDCVHEWLAHAADGVKRWNTQPPLCLLLDLARRCAEGQPGEHGRWAVWIGRWCWPYPPLLARDEAHGPALIDRSLFVDPRDADTRLWAMELAVRNPAVTVVVGDGRGLSMAASRRLQLAAEAGQAQVLLARSPTEHKTLSAAAMRWRAAPLPTRGEQPRWRIELVRCKGMQRRDGTDACRTWTVEWNSAQGRVVTPADVADRASGSPASDSSSVARISA